MLTLSTCLTLRSDPRAVKHLQILRLLFLAKNQFYISSNVGGVIFRANVGKPDYKEEITTAHRFTEMSAKVGNLIENIYYMSKEFATLTGIMPGIEL